MADVDYDPLAPDVLADPAEAYRRLRERCPVHLVEDFSPPHYVISRHVDVDRILRDPGSWSSAKGHGPGFSGNQTLAYCDDPRHGQQRRLVSRAFTPRSVQEIRRRTRSRRGSSGTSSPPRSPIGRSSSMPAAPRLTTW